MFMYLAFNMFNYLKFERHKRSVNYPEFLPFGIRLLFPEFLQKYIGSRGKLSRQFTQMF